MVNSGAFDGLDNETGKVKITEFLEDRGTGESSVNFRIRDWLVSRQRYWGTPIPVIYCDDCGAVPVPEQDLPVELPTDIEFSGEGGSPLARLESFVNTRCPKCGKACDDVRPIPLTRSSKAPGISCVMPARNMT